MCSLVKTNNVQQLEVALWLGHQSLVDARDIVKSPAYMIVVADLVYGWQRGLAPIHHAAHKADPTMLLLLLARGANVNAPDHTVRSDTHWYGLMLFAAGFEDCPPLRNMEHHRG